MNEARIEQARRWVEALAMVVGFMLCSFLALFCRPSSPAMVGPSLTFVSLFASIYAVLLCTLHHKTDLTLFRVRVVYLTLHALVLVRLAVTGTDLLYLITRGVGAMLRTLLGLAVLDWRLSLPVNLLLTIVCLTKAPPPSLTDAEAASWVMSVLGESAILQTCLCAMEVFLTAHIRLSFGMLLAESVQQGVRRLLAVLCDAELFLTPSLEIRDPSLRATHLLAPGETPGAVDGRAFADFLSAQDRARFRGFLSEMASSRTAAGPSEGPAGSLQISLRDATGRDVPVAIFHAALPEPGGGRQLGHLLGISESGRPDAEAERPDPAAFAAAVAPAGNGGDAPGRERPAPRSPGGSQPSPGVAGAAACGADPEDAAPSASSASSGSAVLQHMGLPRPSRFDVCFNPFSQGFDVAEIRCIFKTSGVPARPDGPPSLLRWISRDMRRRFEMWVQEQLNAAVYGGTASLFEGPLLLQWPSPNGHRGGDGDGVGEPALLACCVAVAPDEPAEARSEEDSGSEEADGEQLMVLRLQKLRPAEVRPGHRDPQHRSRRMRGAQGPCSMQGRHGSAQQLPPISEARPGDAEEGQLRERRRRGSS